jgi:nucleoid DNA-binding protein
MTKAELIEKISRSKDLPPDITKKCIAEIVDLTFSELAQYFEKAKVTRTSHPRFTFPGFGTLTKKRRSARRGVNPRTLEPIEIEAFYTLDFKPAAGLRKSMNENKRKVAVKSTAKTTAKAKAKTKTKTAGTNSTRRSGDRLPAPKRLLSAELKEAEVRLTRERASKTSARRAKAAKVAKR